MYTFMYAHQTSKQFYWVCALRNITIKIITTTVCVLIIIMFNIALIIVLL